MKNDQQEEARKLYFQTSLSKSEIAAKVGVNRKTVLYWSQQGNWDQIRLSARNMPSLVAEKCYHLIDHYFNRLLVDNNVLYNSPPVSLKEAQTIHLLATTIKKLKNRSTVNESMEMFNFFLGGLNRRDPELAALVAPQIEEYIEIRKNVETTDHLTEEFYHDATLPFPGKEIEEKIEDERDNKELYDEFEELIKARKERAASAAQQNTTPPPNQNEAA